MLFVAAVATLVPVGDAAAGTDDGLFDQTGAISAGATFSLTVAGRGGVPGSGVGSVALNVTAVNPSGSGYITVWPAGQTQPNASNLNFVGGQTIPNMVIVPLGANGQISLFSSATVDLLVDVLGWFPTGSSFTGITPARLMDTRVPPPPPGQSKIRVLSLDFIPLIDRGGSMQDWPIDTIQARQRLGVASPSSAPIDDFYGEYDFSLSQVRSRIDGTEPIVVDTLELGSRYRGSGTAALDYEIVHRAEFLKPIPLSPSRSYGGNPLPDYLRLLSDVDICGWVDDQQVREVWIWSYQGVRKSGWESNLSFRGGDISNSDQDPTDLPLCGHSYTVYEYNYGRGPQQAVHNHMHQFERIFALINGGQPFSRFWSAASCGTTHRPPNSDHDYQYDSMTLATSDCEKWSMVGPQAGTGVNAQTWSRTVPNGDPELGFYVWWMQNVPGLQSSATSANWWAMIADLDEAYPRRDRF